MLEQDAEKGPHIPPTPPKRAKTRSFPGCVLASEKSST
jgi:hypothetical protein